jgi:hypothetical protein
MRRFPTFFAPQLAFRESSKSSQREWLLLFVIAELSELAVKLPRSLWVKNKPK